MRSISNAIGSVLKWTFWALLFGIIAIGGFTIFVIKKMVRPAFFVVFILFPLAFSVVYWTDLLNRDMTAVFVALMPVFWLYWFLSNAKYGVKTDSIQPRGHRKRRPWIIDNGGFVALCMIVATVGYLLTIGAR